MGTVPGTSKVPGTWCELRGDLCASTTTLLTSRSASAIDPPAKQTARLRLRIRQQKPPVHAPQQPVALSFGVT